MRFNHITLLVTDLERSKAFYRTLGLIQIVDTPPRYARFQFPDGDATLSVEVTGDPLAAPASAQLFFECDALDETVAALKSKGLEFEQEPTDMFYLWREARLRDPDGYDVRLYHAGDNRLNPPWKKKGIVREAFASIRRVSASSALGDFGIVPRGAPGLLGLHTRQYRAPPSALSTDI